MQFERRSPKAGYLFDAKAAYRRHVWTTFADYLGPRVDSATVLFLPSKEGAEIPLALSLGFREENLIAVDDNPALIAASQWRRVFPKVRFYGNTLERAAERMLGDGVRLDAANLDLCSNFSEPQISAVASIEPLLMPDSVVALTVLKGRESKSFSALLGRVLPRGFPCDLLPARLAVPLMEMCPVARRWMRPLVSEEYASQTQRMMYGVVAIRDGSFLRAEWDLVVKRIADQHRLLILHEAACELRRHFMPRLVDRAQQKLFAATSRVERDFEAAANIHRQWWGQTGQAVTEVCNPRFVGAMNGKGLNRAEPRSTTVRDWQEQRTLRRVYCKKHEQRRAR